MFTVKTVLSGDVSTWKVFPFKQISHDMTSCTFFESILDVLGHVLSTLLRGAVGVSKDKEQLTDCSCPGYPIQNPTANKAQHIRTKYAS